MIKNWRKRGKRIARFGRRSADLLIDKEEIFLRIRRNIHFHRRGNCTWLPLRTTWTFSRDSPDRKWNIPNNIFIKILYHTSVDTYVSTKFISLNLKQVRCKSWLMADEPAIKQVQHNKCWKLIENHSSRT